VKGEYKYDQNRTEQLKKSYFTGDMKFFFFLTASSEWCKLEKVIFLLDEIDKQMQNCITIDGNIDHPFKTGIDGQLSGHRYIYV